ncbi:MAG: glycosyltransferase family 39 protein [Elusimicrobia bacterium]|nr:glycosyltransferase family 39 protein [Elusimicrobiota bacterium]
MRNPIPKPLWLAFAAVLAIRAFQGATLPWIEYQHDANEFEMLARNVAAGRPYSYDGVTPTAFRLPAYPLLLAGVFRLAGQTPSDLPIVGLNTLFSLLAAAGVFFAGKRLLPVPWAAAAAVLFGLNPELAELDPTAGPESLFILEYILAALTAFRVLEAPERAGRWAACGAVLGLGLVTRSTMLAWPPVLAAGLVWVRRGPGVGARAALLLVCCYAFTAAWMVRNKAVVGRAIPFEDGMGSHMLWQGSTSVEGVQPDDLLPEPLRTYFYSKDPRIGPLSKELALANIKADPLRYAGYCLKRIPVMWFRGAWAERTTGLIEGVSVYAARGEWGRVAVKAAFKLLEFCVLCLALFGWFSVRGRPEGLLAGFQLFYMNIHIFTMGLPRYIVMAFPLTALLAVCGAHALWLRFGPARAA